MLDMSHQRHPDAGSAAVDELDLQLVGALQIAPRVPWTNLATILEADATTLARRWQRLTDAGLAWVTAFPRHGLMPDAPIAHIELTCRNGTVLDVASVLAENPSTLSIHFTAGAHQLLLSVAGVCSLSDYLLTVIGALPDVVTYRTHVVTGVPFQGGQWQVHALSPAQTQQLRTLRPPAMASGEMPMTSLTELDHAIIEKLCVDGRASYRELADTLGIHRSTAVRRVNRILHNRVIGLRCDIARAHLGWPIAAVLWSSTNLAGHDTSWSEFSQRIPELRACTSVAGSDNAHIVVWLRSIGELHRVERELADALPDLRVSDRRVILRSMKLMGHILDADQRYQRTIPLTMRPGHQLVR